ncbi:MAG TPA: VOC family protein [Crenalkalicoccus sp.]|nr:VOC family protein [Crenalkalicoccus sp.]
MKIVVTSVLVDDQEKALRFYRDVLGFLPKLDIPMGKHRWLTLVSPADRPGRAVILVSCPRSSLLQQRAERTSRPLKTKTSEPRTKSEGLRYRDTRRSRD